MLSQSPLFYSFPLLFLSPSLYPSCGLKINFVAVVCFLCFFIVLPLVVIFLLRFKLVVRFDCSGLELYWSTGEFDVAGFAIDSLEFKGAGPVAAAAGVPIEQSQ
jgi:hypothetical protein